MVVAGGSGYSAAIMARLCGSVTLVEEDRTLAASARENLAALGITNAPVVDAKLVEGYPAGGPYDAILVAGAVEIVPAAILRQLNDGGLLAAIEKDDRVSRAMLYEKVGTDIAKRALFDAWAMLLPGFERKREFVF